MSKFEIAFADFVIRARWWLIVFSLLLIAVCASGISNLYFVNSYRIFFGEDNPQLIAFDEIERKYAKNDNVMFVIAPDDKQVFTREILAIIEDLTEKAWQIPYSNRVDSITNFQHTEAIEDDLLVANLVSNSAELNANAIKRIKRIALGEPFLVNRLVANDGNSAAVNVMVQIPEATESEATNAIVKSAREIADAVEAKYPNIRIYLTGMVMMNNAFAESSVRDISTLIPLGFAVMAVLLALLAGGLTGTIATLVVITMSILAALGMHGHFGNFMSAPTVIAPTIILTVALANCVHILVTLVNGMRNGNDKLSALKESLRINLHPVCVASVTTAIGFLTLNFSDVPPFRELGTIVAMGVIISFLLSVTLLPALLAIFPVSQPKRVSKDDRLIASIRDFVVTHNRKLFWIMALAILAIVVNIPRNELNDVFVKYFSDPIEFRTHTDFAIDNLTGLYTIDYSLDSGESGGISDPEFLRQVEAFTDWYRQHEEVRHLATYVDIIKRLNMNMHGDDPAMYKLPDDRELAAQYLLLYEMSLPYGLDLNNQINVDKSSLRVTVVLETLSTNEILALTKDAENWLAQNATMIQPVEGTGTTIMFANIGKRNIKTMFVGTVLALILISFVLIIALRSVKIGLVSLIPNLAPAAMGFGLWGIFVGQVGLSLSVVTSMTFGIVVDDTVHFLSKYLRARREQHLPSAAAVKYAFDTVGRALLTTTVVLVAGFLVLATSSFEINGGMGLLTAIIISLAIIADFLFLPPLLMKLESTK